MGKQKSVSDMSDAELERYGRQQHGRATNPLRTHGSHVRSASNFRDAKAERDRRA